MSKWRFRDIKRVKPGSVYLSKQVHEAASHTQDDKGLGLVDAQGKLSTTVFHGGNIGHSREGGKFSAVFISIREKPS